jgi:aminoglycoside phosphotransferase family enzyme/predicted kinase
MPWPRAHDTRVIPNLPARLQALLHPAAYSHPVRSVEVVETHISWVFLTGELAYKIKRPVHLPFVDLRSLERRAFFCGEELRLNRRFAPELYLRVCPVTLENGAARIAGQGEVIDYAVCMRQFPATDELGALLASVAIEPEALAVFGGELARLHAALPRPAEEEPWGRPETVRALLLRNLQECLEAAEKLGTAAAIGRLSGAFTAGIAASDPWIASRRTAGCVHECHGDLHVGNVARFGGRLLGFDCIEFEPAFRWIDVAEEIACLYMDLRARHFDAHAQAFIDGYLRETGDYSASRLLRLYGAHRALVRAKVAALRAAQATDPLTREASGREHGRYLECAAELLRPQRPRLVLMCGMSGSGKTWVAQRLAAALGAVHLRSDVERKRLSGLAAEQRSGAALGEGLYSAAGNAATYERLRRCAAEVLGGHLSVIIDATCQRREQRALLGSLGAGHEATVHIVFCHAPDDVLEARITERQREATDPSEADRRVLALQQRSFEPPDAGEGLAVIDADTTQPAVVSHVLRCLG